MIQMRHEKSISEIVVFFYIWKRSDRYQPVYGQYCAVYRPLKKIKGEFAAASPVKVVAHMCVVCMSEGSAEWHGMPEGAACEECWQFWLKYAAPRIPESVRRLKKKRRLDAPRKPKRSRRDKPEVFDGCAVCTTSGELLTCTDCGLRVHQGLFLLTRLLWRVF